MSIKASWGLTILLAASALAGCAQSRPTVRGQSPATTAPAAAVACPVDGQGPIIGTAPGYAEQTHPYVRKHTHQDFQVYNGFRDNNFGYEGGYYAGPQGYYSDHGRIYTATGAGCPAGGAPCQGSGTGCPACEYGRACPQGGCQHCGFGNCGPGGCPHNYQTYRFAWPQNMVYPPDQVPAGMIQYPYYTLRGPTDFFMK